MPLAALAEFHQSPHDFTVFLDLEVEHADADEVGLTFPGSTDR
jgi:hypothetical protein